MCSLQCVSVCLQPLDERATPRVKFSTFSSLELEHPRGAHATPDAHAHHSVLRRSSLHLVQQRGDASRASRAQRVPQRDGSAVDVHLLGVEPELRGAVRGLRRERLVELEEVNVVDRSQTRLRDRRGDGHRGADTHDFGVDSDRGEGYEPSHDGQTFGVGVRTPREDHAPGAVGDLRRVSRGGGSALLENGRQLGEGIQGGALADSVILLDEDASHLFRLGIAPLRADRDDLRVEPAAFLRGGGARVRPRRERVLLLAGD
mmetsp:Transcript_1560/g.6937  ORF Transcript_1560/g.6937 Transcript_1560/m.6937 type:complete len:260 (+) Transcript_1560:2560-3339(+)